MRIKLLTLFLLVLCTLARSSSDLPLRFTSERRALSPSRSSIQKQNVHERPEISGSILKDSKVEEKHEGSYEANKAQRGKGTTGGSDINHRSPRSQSSPPLMSSWTSILALGLTSLFSCHFF